MTEIGQSPLQPAKLVTYKGETKTVTEWSQHFKIKKSTLLGRIIKHERGEIATLDECFAPVKVRIPKDQPPPDEPKIDRRTKEGKRIAAIRALFDSFLEYVVPALPEEFKHYMQTGEEGKGMKAFLRFRGFFPNEWVQSLDGDVGKQLANISVMVASHSTAPKPVKIVEVQ